MIDKLLAQLEKLELPEEIRVQILSILEEVKKNGSFGSDQVEKIHELLAPGIAMDNLQAETLENLSDSIKNFVTETAKAVEELDVDLESIQKALPSK